MEESRWRRYLRALTRVVIAAFNFLLIHCKRLYEYVRSFFRPPRPRHNQLYEPLLLDDERDAVSHLLKTMQQNKSSSSSDRKGNLSSNANFSDKSLYSLETLINSDNVELQRSAAITLSEITESSSFSLTESWLDLIITLAYSSDISIQRSISAAFGNLALHEKNKVLIVALGALSALVQLLHSSNIEVQCNACGCITNLATNEVNKIKVAQAGTLLPLLKLANSHDNRLQRNAAGALLNLTHVGSIRKQLVSNGAIPVFIALLQSHDVDIQYYSTAAVSNLAVDGDSREAIVDYSNGVIWSCLITLAESSEVKVQCQSCLALRNLASDEVSQLAIVKHGGLKCILKILKSNNIELISVAVAALRNLSIHRSNEKSIVDYGFLPSLCLMFYHMMKITSSDPFPFTVDITKIQNKMGTPTDTSNNLYAHTEKKFNFANEILCHIAGTMRNIAANNDYRKVLAEVQAISLLGNALVDRSRSLYLKSEVASALCSLCLNDDLKLLTCNINGGLLCDLLLDYSISSKSLEMQNCCCTVLCNIATGTSDEAHQARLFLLHRKPVLSHWITVENLSLLKVLASALNAKDFSHQHLGLWLLLQLSKDEICKKWVANSELKDLVTIFHVHHNRDAQKISKSISENLT